MSPLRRQSAAQHRHRRPARRAPVWFAGQVPCRQPDRHPSASEVRFCLHLLAQASISWLLLERYQQGVRVALSAAPAPALPLPLWRPQPAGGLHATCSLLTKLVEVGSAVSGWHRQRSRAATVARQPLRNQPRAVHNPAPREAPTSFAHWRRTATAPSWRIIAERADDLAQWGLQRAQIGPLLGIAKEAVEHLFDLCEIVLDLPGDLANEHFLLRPAGHFVE
jgi:hypothetical protein